MKRTAPQSLFQPQSTPPAAAGWSATTRTFVLLAGLGLAAPAQAFSILGTNAGANLSSALGVTEMFRWNGVPTVGGIKTIGYRLDPTFTPAQQAALGNAFATWNGAVTAQPNMVAAAPGSFDLESVALHEIGHALGLAHSGVREGDTPNPRFFDTDNNAFDRMLNPDVTNLGINAVSRPTVEFYGGPGVSSGVMTYDMTATALGSYTRRQLEFDDLGGLQYAQDGADNRFGTADDFQYRFVPVAGAPVQDFNFGGQLIAGSDIVRNPTEHVDPGIIDVFNFNPFGGGGIADMVYDRSNATGSGPFSILGGDIYLSLTTLEAPDTSFPGVFDFTVPPCDANDVCEGLGSAHFNTGQNASTPFNIHFDWDSAVYPVRPGAGAVFPLGTLSVTNGATFFGTTPEFGQSGVFCVNLHLSESNDAANQGDVPLCYYSSPNVFPNLRDPRNADILYDGARPDLGAVYLLEGSTLAEALTNVNLLGHFGSIDFDGFELPPGAFADGNGFLGTVPGGSFDPVSGLFLIGVPEPPLAALLAFAGLPLLGRRRG